MHGLVCRRYWRCVWCVLFRSFSVLNNTTVLHRVLVLRKPWSKAGYIVAHTDQWYSSPWLHLLRLVHVRLDEYSHFSCLRCVVQWSS